MDRAKSLLNQFSSKATTIQCKHVIVKYLRFVYHGGNPDIKFSEDGDAEKYLTENRNYEEDVTNFFSAIKGEAPETVRSTMSGLRSFFKANRVRFDEDFWDTLIHRVKGTDAVTMDKVPSNVMLRKIMSHLPIQGKALFLVLSSSGMRIGETLKIELPDVNLLSNFLSVSSLGVSGRSL
ncbi:MAG: hypothetical protein WED04_00785 [Promethearchaeati archaeon SRVP18_Atabeyarchaeia-1]